MNLPETFWAKVDASGDCWEWTGARTGGYGNFKLRDRPPQYVHRLIWEALVGPIPAGYQMDHLCRVRHCVNPDHLEPVTLAENVRRSRRRKGWICHRGHSVLGANAYWRPDGYRECKACLSITQSAYYKRQEEKREGSICDVF